VRLCLLNISHLLLPSLSLSHLLLPSQGLPKDKVRLFASINAPSSRLN